MIRCKTGARCLIIHFPAFANRFHFFGKDKVRSFVKRFFLRSNLYEILNFILICLFCTGSCGIFDQTLPNKT